MSAIGSDLPDDEPGQPAAARGKTRLQRLRWPLMMLAIVVVLAVGTFFYIRNGRYQSTDDAYTQAATVSISSNVAGRVIELDVHDNQIVHRGATLFRLDDAPFRIEVEDASAHLAATRLNIESLKSTYRQRLVALREARDSLVFEQQQYDRQKRLLGSGIASRAQFDQAAHALDDAKQQVANVQEQIAAALSNLDGDPNIPPERHPLVLQAQAALDRARLNLSYTVIKAPTDGIVTKVEQLQVGDYIATASPVFALVSTQDIWIEANFKEVQLAHMRVGQTATVKIDRYPANRFTAVVSSLSPGTGSQFSLLPPENATGNWVKVVQRVPVRLQLTNVDAGIDMQAGLSADVTVDIHSRTVAVAKSAPTQSPPSEAPTSEAQVHD